MRHITPKAFTLIELLVVVAIISILASIAIVNLADSQVRAKVGVAKADMRTIRTGLEAYFIDHSTYPPNRLIVGVLDGDNQNGTNTGYNVTPYHITTPIAYITTLTLDPFRPPRHNPYTFTYPGYEEQLPHYGYYNVISRRRWNALRSDLELESESPISFIAVGDAGPEPRFRYTTGGLAGGNIGAFTKYGTGREPAYLLFSVGPDLIAWNGFEDFGEPSNPGSLLRMPPSHPPWGHSFDVPYDPSNGSVSFGNIINTRGAAGNNLYPPELVSEEPGRPPEDPELPPIVGMSPGGRPESADSPTGGEEEAPADASSGPMLIGGLGGIGRVGFGMSFFGFPAPRPSQVPVATATPGSTPEATQAPPPISNEIPIIPFDRAPALLRSRSRPRPMARSAGRKTPGPAAAGLR